MSRQNGPVIFDLDQTELPDVATPAEAPPVPEPGEAALGALTISAGRPSGFARLFWGSLGGLLLLGLGVTATDFILGLFERAPWLGWIGAGLAGALALLLLSLALREMAALSRLGRIEKLSHLAAAGEAKPLVEGLAQLYKGRPELEIARQDMAAALGDTPDAATLLATAERSYLMPLDRLAEQEIARAARNVAAWTALIPLAALDVLAVLFANLRMVRRIAEIYGGRAGWFGSVRLMRAVAAHLIATGAVAATDDMLGPLVGGGVVGKLSRRFGEAAVNAAMTARVGVSAIEVCRPMPFAERPIPRASGIVLSTLKDWRRED